MLYMATYGYILYRQPPISLRVWASDGSGLYHRLTIQFMAIPIYGMVQSPNFDCRPKSENAIAFVLQAKQ